MLIRRLVFALAVKVIGQDPRPQLVICLNAVLLNDLKQSVFTMISLVRCFKHYFRHGRMTRNNKCT